MPMLLLSCLPSLFCLSFCFLHLGALLLGQGLLSKSPQSKGSSSEIITRETLKATSSDGSHASGVGRLISTEAQGLCIQCTRSPQAAAKAREHTAVKVQLDKTPKQACQGEEGPRRPPVSNPGLQRACWDLHYVSY